MTSKPIQIEQGQHYEHERGQIYTIVFVNSDVVLLYDGRNYRLERRYYFKDCIESGTYNLLRDFNVSDSEVRIPFEEIEWIGEKGIESLEKAGLTTPKDFDYWTDERILELKAVGEKGLKNINEWIEENTTKTVEI